MTKKTIAILLTAALCTNAAVPILCAQEINVSSEQQADEAPAGQPPAKPEGDMPQGEKPDGEPPAKPEGDMSQDGQSDGQPPAKPGEDGGPGGMAEAVDHYDAVNTYKENTELSGETITSKKADENAVLVTDGAEVEIKKSDISRVSEESKGGDSASFYGVGAAMLVTDGTLTISDSTITTDADGGAGVFAYGDGVTHVSNTKISTQKGASGGIHVAGGGTLYANNLDVTTQGGSSAAIRSDRGGGKMIVDGGSYVSNGAGSPAVYCTAEIEVSNADLTANGSEAVCIEGKNSLKLDHVNLTGNMGDDERNDCTWNVILYQSMSGDSEVGNSSFTMTGGTMQAADGGLFYTTNTESTFLLENVDITYPEQNDFFLKCTGNANQRGWGKTGANGANSTFTAIKQEMQGDVIWDSISTLEMKLTKGSSLKGAIIDDESNAGDGGNGSCSMSIDDSSSWIVTGDSSLTKLSVKGTIKDEEGQTVTIAGNDGSVYVKGDSAYTITVGNYEVK